MTVETMQAARPKVAGHDTKPVQKMTTDTLRRLPEITGHLVEGLYLTSGEVRTTGVKTAQ